MAKRFAERTSLRTALRGVEFGACERGQIAAQAHPGRGERLTFESEFVDAVTTPIVVMTAGGGACSYADYLALPASDRTGDEADVVDRWW
jgi:hypothetical protein